MMHKHNFTNIPSALIDPNLLNELHYQDDQTKMEGRNINIQGICKIEFCFAEYLYRLLYERILCCSWIINISELIRFDFIHPSGRPPQWTAMVNFCIQEQIPEIFLSKLNDKNKDVLDPS